MNKWLRCLGPLMVGFGLLLGGCGGGSGERAQEAAPALGLEIFNPEQQLTVSQQDQTSNYVVDFFFVVRNLSQSGEVYFQAEGSENAVSSAEIFQGGPENFTLRLFLRVPSSLEAGDYLDTVTLRACMDPKCQRPIAGSPATLTLRCRVEAPPPPPPPPPRLLRQELTGIRIQALSTGFDYGDSVYASLAGDSPAGAGTVARFRPDGQGGLERLTLLPALEQLPGALAHGFGMLYVALPGSGQIERIRTDNNTREAVPLTVGSSLLGQRLDAVALATNGGESVAAIRARADGSTDSIAYYLGGEMEGRAYGGNFLQPVDSNVLVMAPDESLAVGLNTRKSDYALHRFSLSSQGVASEERISDIGAGAGEQLTWSVADNYLYSDRGRIYDPKTGELVARLDDPELIATTLHPYLRRLISLSKGAAAEEAVLRVYALEGGKLRLIETVTIPNLPAPRSLQPWGLDGVVTIGADGRLVHLYGPAIAGN